MEPTQSNSAPSEPPAVVPGRRRRRRLTIAALVLLALVSLYSWWYWPRGDARFVGKWGAFPDGSDKQMGVFEFGSNGFGSAALADGRVSFPWFVKDHCITFGHDSAGWISPHLKRAAEALLAVTGRTFAYDSDVFDFAAIDHEEIRLLQRAAGHKLILRRIPE